jgi:Fe2+ transport system protein FeoA
MPHNDSQQANAAQEEIDALRQRLRDLGIDPDSVK